MVWIPPGPLVAGTPPEVLPRIADEEMPGEQVVQKGFFISLYPYPNEEGAIPIANVTQVEAAALCEEQKKRLCTELEWERACKGPDNDVYEYGDRYRPEVCGTGQLPRMMPSGFRVGCRSAFGVHDMHGGLWEWTSSPWGRGNTGNLVTVRGGNARAGDLVGRCANAAARAPESKSPDVGFRCCAGEKNEAEVVLHVVRRGKLYQKEPLDQAIAARVRTALAAASEDVFRELDSFRPSRMWYWHPIGNEELVILAGCTETARKRRCGAVIARMVLDESDLMAFSDSGRYLPTVKTDVDPRHLWVYGGDDRSHFRRLMSYLWGRVGTGEVDRNLKPRRKRRSVRP